MNRLARLEKYTAQQRQEVLLVTATVEGELEQIAIFRGFSSSLMRSTAFDPDIPVLPELAEILRVDRLQAPYEPDNPHYLQQNLTHEQMEALLAAAGIV